MFKLLVVDWIQTTIVLLGGGTLGVVLANAIQWLRFRRKDLSDQERVDAETEKLKAEAIEIKAKADVTVAEAALKLAQRISDECEATRHELEHTQSDLSNTIKKLEEVTDQLRIVQQDLISERKRAQDNQVEIDKLREQLNNMNKNQNDIPKK